jgi:hypothetical protein
MMIEDSTRAGARRQLTPPSSLTSTASPAPTITPRPLTVKAMPGPGRSKPPGVRESSPLRRRPGDTPSVASIFTSKSSLFIGHT